MNCEEYRSIANCGTARRFITIPVNCTYYVADCSHNYTLYSECTFNGGWIFRNNSSKAATNSTVSHSSDVTAYQTVFFIRISNFGSSLTQQHCLLPQCYCFWWNWQNTEQNVQCSSGVPRGGGWGVQPPPPRNSEDIGGVLDRISKKNRRLDFLL